MSEERITLKLILVGDPGVGKTSLISQYVHGIFKTDYEMTIGFNITIKKLDIDYEGKRKGVSISLYDIGGQERFEGVRHMFYPGSHLAMLVYDVTRPDSLDRLVNVWSKEVHKHNPVRENEPPVQIILVGNKSDMVNMRMIEFDEGVEMAKKLGAIKHLESSAKDNKNVNTAFHDLVMVFLDKAVDANRYLSN
ncbi:MAG: GTP-binding protein [Candidatus Hodarchaeales archaeon]|jgi:small GTP-binding protein